MSNWAMIDDDERNAKVLQVIQELIAVLGQERKHIVAFEQGPLVPIHLRKIELVAELAELRASVSPNDQAQRVACGPLPSPLVQQVQVAAHRLEIEARINALLCGEATAALSRRLGAQPESTGTYDKRAARSMNIPARVKRAA